MLISACGKTDSTSKPETASKTEPAAPAAPSAAASSEPAGAEMHVRLVVTLDGHNTKLTIPPTQPATFEQAGWTKKLAMFATPRGPDAITLQVGFVARSDDQVDLTVFKQQAAVSKEMTRGDAITLEPGKTLPGDGFGDAPPREIKIAWPR